MLAYPVRLLLLAYGVVACLDLLVNVSEVLHFAPDFVFPGQAFELVKGAERLFKFIIDHICLCKKEPGVKGSSFFLEGIDFCIERGIIHRRLKVGD